MPPRSVPGAATRYLPKRSYNRPYKKQNRISPLPACLCTYLSEPQTPINSYTKKVKPPPEIAHSTPSISKEPSASNPQPYGSPHAQSSKPHALPPSPSPLTHSWMSYKEAPFSKTSISTPSPSSSPSHHPQPRDQPTLRHPRPASCSGAISPPDCRCLPNRR